MYAKFSYQQLEAIRDKMIAHVEDVEFPAEKEKLEKEFYTIWSWKRFRFVKIKPVDVWELYVNTSKGYLYLESKYYWSFNFKLEIARLNKYISVAKSSFDGCITLNKIDIDGFCGFLEDI